MKKPRYKHDCNSCKYLGHFVEYDLYYCPCLLNGPLHSTVIARYGNEGSEYASGINSMTMPNLNEAKRRTIKKLGVNFEEFNPLELSELVEYLHNDINPCDIKILHKETRSILYIRLKNDEARYREKLYLASYFARKLSTLGYYNIIDAEYDPKKDRWHTSEGYVNVKFEVSLSQEMLDTKNVIFIENKYSNRG